MQKLRKKFRNCLFYTVIMYDTYNMYNVIKFQFKNKTHVIKKVRLLWKKKVKFNCKLFDSKNIKLNNNTIIHRGTDFMNIILKK